jgi:hypothetical protein
VESTRWCCNNGGTQGYKHAQAAVELLSPRGFRAVGDREDEGTVERSPPARSVDIRSKVGEKKEEGADRADSPGPHVRERGYPLSRWPGARVERSRGLRGGGVPGGLKCGKPAQVSFLYFFFYVLFSVFFYKYFESNLNLNMSFTFA